MYVPGSEPEAKLLRKTLCRQCNLIGILGERQRYNKDKSSSNLFSFFLCLVVLLLRSLSESVRKRLESLQDVVDAGTNYKIVSRLSINL